MRKVPKLRFKEFSDEWEKLNAEEIFENISNKKHNGDLPVLAVTQDKGVVSRDSLDLKINSSEEGIKNYKIIEPGNFIISLRSFQGGIEYSDILGIGSPAYTVLKSKKNIEDIFYKFYLKKSSFISELNKTIEGIRDGKQISYSMFSKLKLPYPSIEEQEKIANFLSSIDKKISLTEEKLELFREYKKGVVQKIFSQELRFKDGNGNDYPEWNYLKAGNIFENISNKNHDGNLPILAVTQDKGVVYRDDLDLKINSSEDGIKNYKIIEPGNFIISLRSFQGGIEYSTILGISSPAYTILKAKIKIIDIFYKFYLKKSSFISELNKTIEGIRDGKQISYSMFSKLFLPYPTLEEQQKIADFLFSIDSKIESIEKELEGLKEFKKGLLQQMFI